jgi:hypothetical protein
MAHMLTTTKTKFFHSTNIDELVRWFNKAYLPKELFEPFRLFKANEIGEEKYTPSNTDKATKFYSCFIKSKTRVQIICATNCGFIVRFREMFGVESHTQEAKLLLDACDCFNGNVLLWD